MRATALALVLSVALGGCATGDMSGRRIARGVLIAVAAGTAALAVGSAVAGRKVQNDLTDDIQKGMVSGRDFANRDNEGLRWNRIARASLYGFGLAVIGLGVVWEAGLGEHASTAPRERIPVDDTRLVPPPEAAAGYRSAAAR